MNRIELHAVMPRVFAAAPPAASEVWGKDVVFERGETYLIEAASGTGKSTLCSYLLGYRRDYSGQILFDGASSSLLSVSAWATLRRESLAMLFQELRLFPELTAWENVAIKNRLTHHLPSSKVDEWFTRLGLEQKRNVPLAHLSFGQQQRVAMMRALSQPFQFILADEPISHLDEDNASIMGEIMMEEAKRQSSGVILTSIGKHITLPYDKILTL